MKKFSLIKTILVASGIIASAQVNAITCPTEEVTTAAKNSTLMSSIVKPTSSTTNTSKKVTMVFNGPKTTSTPTTTTKTVEVAPVNVDLSGNAYITANPSSASIKDTGEGLTYWSRDTTQTEIFVYVTNPGNLVYGLQGTPSSGSIANVSLNVLGQTSTIKMVSGQTSFDGGSVNVTTPGFVKFVLKGVNKNTYFYPTIKSLQLCGPAAKGLIYANDAANYYWSRRGTSVNIGYDYPSNAEYFYNEVTVPEGRDPNNSYYMTNGFDGGYFGLQTKEGGERWVIFSIWNPDKGTTKLIKAGEGVKTETFGGEGTGGKSYLSYKWKTGTTYGMLVRSYADGSGGTYFSAWIFMPEKNSWQFIATWQRPNTKAGLRGLYSFVENFDPRQGHLTRGAFFARQFTADSQGVWKELTTGRTGVDDTGRKKQRIDYSIQVQGNQYYMENGGFAVDGRKTFDVNVKRTTGGSAPTIQLNLLPTK